MKINSMQIAVNNPSQILIAGIFKGKTPQSQGGEIAIMDSALGGLITNVLKEEEHLFKGELGKTLTFRTGVSFPAQKMVLVGLGDENKLDLNSMRQASISAIKAAEKEKRESVSTTLHLQASSILPAEKVVQAMVESTSHALYKFDKYKSTNNPTNEVKTLTILTSSSSDLNTKIDAGARLGIITSGAQKLARDIASEPANIMTPERVAEKAREIAKENDLEIEILDREQCKKLGMGAFEAVTQGSNNPPQFVVIRYIPKNTPKEKVVIIGKGVTFDSGGLSIKTAEGMETMKSDKSGAGIVIGVMSTMKELHPDVAVTMIAPLVENMTGGSASRPGDIIRAMNGKTIEILNTDAEGRLILADAISYAVMKEKPDKIIDLATLTGACVAALGSDKAGVMSNSDDVANKIIASGEATGEQMHRLIITEGQREGVKSPVADLKNIARGQPGAQVGFAFLEQFTNDPNNPEAPQVPLGHIDIAGPAWPKNESWPTGFGTRTIIDLLNK